MHPVRKLHYRVRPIRFHISVIMTIRELARLAGVAHSTVSRALQNSPRLSSETRARIQALASEHGYRPHPLVATLMAQLPHIKTINRSTLALVTTFPAVERSAFLHEIYSGIQKRADALGYLLEEFSLDGKRMSGRRLSNVLYSRGIQGVIIFPMKKSPSHLSLVWERFTSVAIGRSLARPPLNRVSFSQFENAAFALRRLHKLGYSRIALLLGENLFSRGGDAYLAAYGLYQRGIPPGDRLRAFICRSGVPAEVAAWLRAVRAEAILCNYEVSPADLEAEGFAIPEKLGYATLDRYAASEEVTGIDQRPRSVGAAAVDVLTAHLHRHERGIPPFAKITVIEGEWIAGQTVRKLAAPVRSPGPSAYEFSLPLREDQMISR